jgi:hypothetical protein
MISADAQASEVNISDAGDRGTIEFAVRPGQHGK